jgi:hypothetical protein
VSSLVSTLYCAIALLPYRATFLSPELTNTHLSPATPSAFALACAAATSLYASSRLGLEQAGAAEEPFELCSWSASNCLLYCECAKLLYALGLAEVVAARGKQGVELLGSIVYRTALRVIVGAAEAGSQPTAADPSQRTASSDERDQELQQRAEQCADLSLQLLMHARAEDAYAAVSTESREDRVVRALLSALQRQLQSCEGVKSASQQAATLTPVLVNR